MTELKPQYLLEKRGVWYKPDNHGYTGVKEYAGRYFNSDAVPDNGVIAIHEDAAPEYSRACYPDVAAQHAAGVVAAIKAENATLQAENEKLREGLEVLASNEAMTSSFAIKNNNEGEELVARLDFARNLLKGGE